MLDMYINSHLKLNFFFNSFGEKLGSKGLMHSTLKKFCFDVYSENAAADYLVLALV